MVKFSRHKAIALSALATLAFLLALLGGLAFSDRLPENSQPLASELSASLSPETAANASVVEALTADHKLVYVARAAIETVAWAEIGPNWDKEVAYRTMFGGATFTSYAAHPDSVQCALTQSGEICSAAAGRYQFMPGTWEELYERYNYWPVGPNGETFTPEAQTLGFLRLLVETHAFSHLEKGMVVLNSRVSVKPEFITSGMNAAADTWCSLPGYDRGECNDPRQSQKDLGKTISFFNERLAELQT